MARPRKKSTARGNGAAHAGRPALPGQVVLVLQGGGALGAYQVGVYQALHEAGIEPDWVIGRRSARSMARRLAGTKARSGRPDLPRSWNTWDHTFLPAHAPCSGTAAWPPNWP